MNFPGPIVLQTFKLENSRAQPNYTSTAPIGYSFETRKQNTGQCVIAPHGPSMYILSIVLSRYLTKGDPYKI